MGWLFGVIALVAILFVLWDGFVRGRQGPALILGAMAALVLVVTGVAKGADARGPWPLIGLIVGFVLLLVAEALHRGPRDTAD
jgi:hypothetical protein